MRTLVYISLGFAAACGSCAWFLPEKYRLAAAVGALVASLIAVLVSRKGKGFLSLALVLLGCGGGLLWFMRYEGHFFDPVRAMDGSEAVYSVRASDFGTETEYGMRIDGTMVISGRTYRVRLYLNERISVFPGDLITGRIRLRLTVPEAMEESAYDQGNGVFLLAYQRGDVTAEPYDVRWYDRISLLRSWLHRVLEESFPADTAPFAAALLLGDGSGLDYETDTSFKVSGIRHVIAVSGLHVSVLFALVSSVTFRKRFLTALLGFPVLFLFAALAGFSPSVTRACIMTGLMLLALLAEKEYDGPTALAFSALVMLIANPLVITSVSFQLSVGSVAGIYLFDPALRKWLLSLFPEEKRGKSILIKWICASVSITISAMVFTAPLSALHFGAVSLAGVLTNLLTLWVITFIFYMILLICLLATFSASAAAMVAAVVSVPIRYILLVAKVIGAFPLAAVYTRSVYIVLWLGFVYLQLGIFLLQRQKRPVELICCANLGLCLALLLSWAEPMCSNVRFSVLDVGQGQCLLFQSEGKNIMIDCGGSSDTKSADIAAETLLSQGITKLDGLILTHLDRDHAGAVKHLLTRVDTSLLILPPVHTDLPQHTSGRVIYGSEDLTLSWETGNARIFAANFPGNSNEMSLCILFDTEKCDILITGDRNGFGERTLMRYHTLPEVDILVAGHHGAGGSTCEELLDAVRPEMVCISVGEDNPYGHPAPKLLQRLEERGCSVYRTDQQGTILIRR